MGLHGGVDRRLIINSIPDETLDGLIHLGYQRRDLRGVLRMAVRHRRGNDPALVIHANMQFCPALAVLLTVFLGVLFALATDLQPRAVDDQVNRPMRVPITEPTDLHCGIAP